MSVFFERPTKPAGYAALVQRFGLRVIPNWHESHVAATGVRRVERDGDRVRETYTASYWPGDGLGDQLEFALKYDGSNLALLSRIFEAADPAELVALVRSRPTGKYARRLWYLYETLTGRRLPLADLARGSYVDLLEPDRYYAIAPGTRVHRQRVNDNLPGDARFCPLVRRTEALRRLDSADLRQRCRDLVSAYPPGLLRRALSYLYTKETKSSFAIEALTPDASRTERFIVLLQRAERDDLCDEAHLIELQNRIVDPRFAAQGYRTTQNYVGEAVAWQQERVHFVSPRPEDLPDLMAGLIAAHRRMGSRGGVDPVVHAAAVAYGFVFLHPFEDGNGRIHRLLIHNILARRGVTPDGLMFPVSAAMLKDPAAYDASLEAFSRPLKLVVDWSLDEEGRMTVLNETAAWYRFIDMTTQAEALLAFIERTIETELVEELAFLAGYDRAKSAIQGIVDLPDRPIDLFIRFCLQNDGRLAARKRASDFGMLTDDEVERMEQAVRDAFRLRPAAV